MDKKIIDFIIAYYKNERDMKLSEDDVYIVWKCKVLQNWKYMLSTNVADTRYFEVTYNGDKDEFYLDAYVKERNLCIRTELS